MFGAGMVNGSPCIDVGKTLEWMDGTSKDIVGNPRVWIRRSGVPDVGAWENKYHVGFSLYLR